MCYRYQPTTCANPDCNNDPLICPGSIICEPLHYKVFDHIDTAVIIIFTIEYLLKLLLSGTVPRRLTSTMNSNWDENEVKLARIEQRLPEMDPPPISWYYQMLLYSCKLGNLIDLVAILPFYIQLRHEGPDLTFFRIARLIRLLRLTNIANSSNYTRLLSKTLSKSIPILIPLCVFVALIILLFGCIIYLVEQGKFTVNTTYPEGAYLRRDLLDLNDEISPYKSIATAMYYVVVTTTTVGYGDLIPTSGIGRFLACIFAYVGILIWTFPIAIIGKNFLEEYRELINYEAQCLEIAKHSSKVTNMSTEEGFLTAFELLRESILTLKTNIDQSEEMKISAEHLVSDGKEAMTTGEVLRHALAPPQEWLEHF